MFENDVKTYSIQTEKLPISAAQMFENDVKTYSIQTIHNMFEYYTFLHHSQTSN